MGESLWQVPVQGLLERFLQAAARHACGLPCSRITSRTSIPTLVEGMPHTKPLDETAANFIVRMVHKYPGEVVIWAGGPLTNVALALRLDPQVATLAKELVLMGSGMYANDGGINTIDGRREFNWWFDPEAVRIVMRAPWKKITITPIDISIKTTVNPELKSAIAKSDLPVAKLSDEVCRGKLHVGRTLGRRDD